MNKNTVALARVLEESLCRFTHGNVQLEVIASRSKPGADVAERQLASFEHEGMHYAVREVQARSQPVDPLHEILTVREREIVRLVAAGLRNKQIAYELTLSEYTVAAYVKHICYKLQVRNRTAMVTRCNQLTASPLGEVAEGAWRGSDPWRRGGSPVA